MQINITFVIQIINFWITYGVVHKLLLKPFVARIRAKEATKTTLEDGIKTKETTLSRLHEDKKKNQEEFQSYLKKHYIFTTPQLQAIPITSTFVKDQKEIDALQATIKTLIIQKVPHAF